MNSITKNINELIDLVFEKIGKPINERAVLATIESLGIREQDTVSDFGFPSLNHLSLYIYNLLSKRDISDKQKALSPHIFISNYLYVQLKLFITTYSLGMSYLIPVFIQIVAIIALGYSLWTSIQFNSLQATAVVLGVILGMILSGGVIQIIGNQLSFYCNHKKYNTAKNFVFTLLIEYLKFLLFIYSAITIICYLTSLVTLSVVIISIVYAFFISVLLVSIGLLYPLKKQMYTCISIAVGTGVTSIVLLYTSASSYSAHWLGMLLVIVLNLYFLWSFLSNKDHTKSKPKIISINTTLYKNRIAFCYGTLFYIFFFTDRLIAWTTTNAYQKTSLLFSYDKDYEIGMDIAILFYLLLAGLLEYSIVRFSQLLNHEQHEHSLCNSTSFKLKAKKLYTSHAIIYNIGAILTFIGIYVLIIHQNGYENQFNVALSAISHNVFVIACVSYFFMTWAIKNCMYLMVLQQYSLTIKPIVISLILNFLVGFSLSRLISYEYSVFGLLLGSICFFILTLMTLHKFYKNLDYYYYAAF